MVCLDKSLTFEKFVFLKIRKMIFCICFNFICLILTQKLTKNETKGPGGSEEFRGGSLEIGLPKGGVYSLEDFFEITLDKSFISSLTYVHDHDHD